MAMALGTRLGPYEILAPLGAGGMGEVYKARDTRLGREVAIKVLPEEFAKDRDRLQRFEREAQSVAALSHPNIMALHDFGREGDVPYAVMEFLEGSTLRRRLADGPLPVRKAVDIAVEVAQGLGTAHEKGIVHRDLKPENLFVTKDGRVKILDFGLAKVLPAKATEWESTRALEEHHSTASGVILGTVGYLSPEQAKGEPADSRSDIFSLGAVLYEMLTGVKPFYRDSMVETLHAVLKEEPPPFPESSAPVPLELERIVRRCLEKSPGERFQSARDLAFALGALSSKSTQSGISHSAIRGARRPKVLSQTWLLGGAAALAVLMAGTALLGWRYLSAASSRKLSAPACLAIDLPEDYWYTYFSASPDGTSVVLSGFHQKPGEPLPKRMLFVRRLDGFDIKPLPGTERAVAVMYSPDGRWIAFMTPDPQSELKWMLKKMPLDGSAAPMTITEASTSWADGAWLKSGDFVFLDAEGWKVLRLSAKGGTPERIPIGKGAFKGKLMWMACPVRDGKGLLVVASAPTARANQEDVGFIDLEKKTFKILVENAGNAALSPEGDLYFSRRSELLAARFDASKGTLLSQPVTVTEGLRTWSASGYGSFDMDARGTLYLIKGGMGGMSRSIQVVTTEGKGSDWSPDRRPFSADLVVSPHAKFLATVLVNADGFGEIWVSDLDRPSFLRLVSESAASTVYPVLSPDEEHLAFLRTGDDKTGIYMMPLDGSSPPRLLLEPKQVGKNLISPQAFTPDGGALVVGVAGSEGEEGSLSLLPLGRDLAPSGPLKPVFSKLRSATWPTFSPDGKRLAFYSYDSRKPLLCVANWQPGKPVGVYSELPPDSLSTDSRILWAPGGKSVYVVDESRRVCRIPVGEGSVPSLGVPVPVGLLDPKEIMSTYFGMDILPDGRFIAVCRGQDEKARLTRLDVILNATTAFRSRMRPSGQ